MSKSGVAKVSKHDGKDTGKAKKPVDAKKGKVGKVGKGDKSVMPKPHHEE